MSLNATFFIGWFGFYLVKGSVGRDRETGVGQIMATTPLTRQSYMLGKWLSNFAVLMTMAVVLALTGVFIQVWKAESTRVDLITYLLPFLLIVLPLLALVAALAVLFEAVPFLQGGFGNIVYFVMFITAVPVIMINFENSKLIAFEPTGIGLLESTMGKAVRAIYPDYSMGFSLGPSEGIVNTFVWNGVPWTSDLIVARLSFFVLAVGLTLLAALFFDRFDPSWARPRHQKADKLAVEVSTNPVVRPAATVLLTSIPAAARQFNFLTVLIAECKLMVKGQRWWWYAVAGGLIIAGFANPAPIVRELVLPLTWIWPILILSGMGSREIHSNVQQMTFSSASPLWRQLPAQWLAGLLLILALSVGAILRLGLDADLSGLLALFSGALFVPTLALTAGVWSGTGKLFEIVYMLIWYLGPMNEMLELDFSGAHSTGRIEFFIPFSAALLAAAIFGRARQLRG